jgi:hypothetical protein
MATLVPRLKREIPIQTNWVNAGTLIIDATTTAPTKGTVATDEVWWRRVGDSMEVRMSYRHTAAGSAGSGDYLFKMPPGYQIDVSKLKVNTTVQGNGFGTIVDSNLGYFFGSNGSVGTIQHQGGVSVYNADYVRLNGASHATASNSGEIHSSGAVRNMSTTALSYNIFFTVPIVGWTSTT